MRELYWVDASPCRLVRRLGVFPAVCVLLLRGDLRFGRRGSRGRRGRRLSFFEIDLRDLPSALICLEVRVVPGKATQARNQVIGEQGNICIVVLQRFVVSAP